MYKITISLVKTAVLVVTLFFASILKAQPFPLSSYDGGYRGSIIKGKKELADIGMSLADSIYFIYYRSYDKENVEFQKRYIGTFSINSQGILHLKGKHPFRGNDFLLSDTIVECTDYEIKWGYSRKLEISTEIRIHESLSTKRGYKMKLRRILYNEDTHPNDWGNEGCCLPDFFYPSPNNIYKDERIKDSVFKNLLSKFGTKCNLKEWVVPSNFKKHNYSESRSFWVDSIRFDTLYINKLFLEKRNNYHIQIDTFCLNKTVKLPLNNFQTYFIFLPEHTEIFDQPDVESAITYEREETDRMDDFRILDYYKDLAGVEWIKVELEVSVYNEEVTEEEENNRYLNKKATGWMLQKLLRIG
jgi:hypothetical protein